MSKPINPNAALVAKAIKAVDLYKNYHWCNNLTCLGGAYQKAVRAGLIEPFGRLGQDFSYLSMIAYNIHCGVPVDITSEDRVLHLQGCEDLAIPFGRWEPVKAKLQEFYNLADEKVLEGV